MPLGQVKIRWLLDWGGWAVVDIRWKEQILFSFCINNPDGHITEDNHILINYSYTGSHEETKNEYTEKASCFSWSLVIRVAINMMHFQLVR